MNWERPSFRRIAYPICLATAYALLTFLALDRGRGDWVSFRFAAASALVALGFGFVIPLWLALALAPAEARRRRLLRIVKVCVIADGSATLVWWLCDGLWECGYWNLPRTSEVVPVALVLGLPLIVISIAWFAAGSPLALPIHRRSALARVVAVNALALSIAGALVWPNVRPMFWAYGGVVLARGERHGAVQEWCCGTDAPVRFEYDTDDDGDFDCREDYWSNGARDFVATARTPDGWVLRVPAGPCAPAPAVVK